jgi:hypothetical protein
MITLNGSQVRNNANGVELTLAEYFPQLQLYPFRILKEGTKAHELAESLLRNNTDSSIHYDDDMYDHVRQLSTRYNLASLILPELQLAMRSR